MKNQFNRFALRFLTTLLFGVALLAMHGRQGPLAAVLAPRNLCPWELSKLAYWPMLVALALSGLLSGGIRKTLERALPCLVLTPTVLFFALWVISLLEPGAGVYLLVWMIAVALGLALGDQEKLPEIQRPLWRVLAVALGVCYVLFAFFPPAVGPFLDPSDVSAMATIPF